MQGELVYIEKVDYISKATQKRVQGTKVIVLCPVDNERGEGFLPTSLFVSESIFPYSSFAVGGQYSFNYETKIGKNGPYSFLKEVYTLCS